VHFIIITITILVLVVVVVVLVVAAAAILYNNTCSTTIYRINRVGPILYKLVGYSNHR